MRKEGIADEEGKGQKTQTAFQFCEYTCMYVKQRGMWVCAYVSVCVFDGSGMVIIQC